MSEHISGGGEQGSAGDRIKLSLSGRQFVQDHFRFWLHDGPGDGVSAPDRQSHGLDDLIHSY